MARRETWEKLKPLARKMRGEPTEAEKLLWVELRDRGIGNFKFRRQHSIGPFIVDFCCSRARLVIEVDGPIHDFQKSEDDARQRFLESCGLRILRFSNSEVLADVNAVSERIRIALLQTVPPSPDAGEGDRG